MLRVIDPIQIRRRVFKTPDGAELVGTLFEPNAIPRAAVVLSGATAVPQGYYHAFANWAAAERGLAVFTYDYRDMGLSSSGPIRQSRATQSDWGVVDSQAARQWMRQSLPTVPLWTLGHSLGGMLLPMQHDISGIDRVICVASGMVHFTDHPWPYRARAMLFWFGLGPVLARALGYVPSKLSGFGADLPGPMFWQWQRWCTQSGFFTPDFGRDLPKPDWRRSSAPVKLISFSDDDLCPPACTQRLASIYQGGEVQHVTIAPADFGVPAIGHLSVFHRRNAALWDTLLEV